MVRWQISILISTIVRRPVWSWLSGGYPEAYDTGFPISGIDRAEASGDVIVFHAGTARKDGQLVTNGGRVIGVTAIGDTIKSSIDRAYEAVGKIDFDNAYFRRDIGHRVLTSV